MQSSLLIFLILVAVASAFRSYSKLPQYRLPLKSVTITDGVQFDHIAREWRFKWSADNDKQSLAQAQQKLNAKLASIKKIPGVIGVQRVVCGGCLDFKVVVKLAIDDFKAWESTKFAPEETFLSEVKAIPGISSIETQTYTLENL